MESDIRRNTLTIALFLIISLFSCTSDSEKPSTNELTSIPSVLSKNQKVSKESSDKTKEKNTSEKKEQKEGNSLNHTLSAHQRLLKALDKNAPIEYAPQDFSVIKNDTLIKSKNHTFQISYATSCINDSLIAQEMLDYAHRQRKSYLISHNYQTNISIKVNGITTGNKLIHKDLFKNKLDNNFLEKSIIKHPNFVRFDEEKNEAIFEFMVGVPNTDWLVIAGINLNTSGSIRIIDILMPEM